MSHRTFTFVLGLACVLAAGQLVYAQNTDDFANKSIEELMNVQVTSVARKRQNLSKAPAAIYVLTQEEIARSGVSTVPELLRMAPGVQVAQVDANRWAISVRGFNDIYSNKVLVLVDGRTVYTPTFSGVYWDQFTMPLDTIERIEVIRGSGGAVWGANAVNGVINIITKSAFDTEGVRVEAGGGSSRLGDYAARYGGKLGSTAAYRAFGHFYDFDSRNLPSGVSGHDGYSTGSGGFRLDWNKSDRDIFMVEGELFRMSGGQTIQQDFASSIGQAVSGLSDQGQNLLGRWTHHSSDSSETTLQVYASGYQRFDTGMHEQTRSYDVDFQHHLRAGSRNDLVWGAGYRLTHDDIVSEQAAFQTQGYGVFFRPPVKSYSLASSFVQDELKLFPSLSLTLGSKFEHNAFSGFETEPSAKLTWLLGESQTLWMAASNSVRQPSRVDTGLDVRFVSAPVNGFSLTEEILGNAKFRAETVRDYETGYRVQPFSRLSMDVTAFYDIYHNLESNLPGAPTFTMTQTGPLITFPSLYTNSMKAHSYGSEVSSDWNISPRWKVVGNYSFIRTIFQRPDAGLLPPLDPSLANVLGPFLASPGFSDIVSAIGSFDPTGTSTRSEPPRSQAGIRSYYDLTKAVSLDTSYYYVASIFADAVPGYNRVDARLGWKLTRHWQASLVGQNLLQPRHFESGSTAQLVPTQVPRSVFVKLVFTF